ncbi:MAG: hypothetical protein JO287_05620 [Pseudonocardiales bacterium]|nr:hypothetical protein [Pseudonocardiales bacterium]
MPPAQACASTARNTEAWTAVSRREVTSQTAFDLELPLGQAAEGYQAMDERRAIKALPGSGIGCARDHRV